MKTQMKFQKILCLVMLILGGLSVLYALSYCTGGLAALEATLEIDSIQGVIVTASFPEAQLAIDVQGFNTTLLYLSIVLVLCAALLYITSTNKRRNYYVSNYVATGIICVAGIAISIYAMVMNTGYLADFNAILNNESAMSAWQTIITSGTADYNAGAATAYSESTVMFILGFVLYIVYIIACLACVFNAIWKIQLMKGEKALLAKGNVVEEVA